MDYREVLRELRRLGNPADAAGMGRFGINTETALGIRIPELRRLAKSLGKNHSLAGELWRSGLHEARILAGMIDDPRQVTIDQMEQWAAAFNSWDLCDQVCMNLFDRTPDAWDKALEWSERDEEFVKRAGFALMACLAWHDKKATDEPFAPFFPAIARAADDPRNFVKKAVNWALRQIGKRNASLCRQAIATGRAIAKQPSRSAQWIARDALQELERTRDRQAYRLD